MAGLTENRRDICRLLWKLWSPHWQFDEATFEASARSFDNPDFVPVVIQSYRHRYGYAPGDPALLGHRGQAAGAADDRRADHQPAWRGRRRRPRLAYRSTVRRKFTGPYERRLIPKVGHNVPQEAPADTVAAIRDLMKGTEP